MRVGSILGLTDTAATDAAELSIVVHEQNDTAYGFVVDEILDVHSVDLSDASGTPKIGIAASTVIGNRVTDAIDLSQLIESSTQTISYQSA